MPGEIAVDDHPCFSESASLHFGRIHLPVAPKCNIQCNYCDRRYDCANENRPGVAAEILQPEEAAKKVGNIIKAEPLIRFYAPDIEEEHERYYDLNSMNSLLGKRYMLVGYHRFLIGFNQVFCYERLG